MKAKSTPEATKEAAAEAKPATAGTGNPDWNPE